MIAIHIILFMKQIYKIHALEMLEDHAHLFFEIQSKQTSVQLFASFRNHYLYFLVI